MSFDYQPVLEGERVELRPLQVEDYEDLYAVAADPLIWEQHPVRNHAPFERAGMFLQSDSKVVVQPGKSGLLSPDSGEGQNKANAFRHRVWVGAQAAV